MSVRQIAATGADIYQNDVTAKLGQILSGS
jgi:hypothetical protein